MRKLVDRILNSPNLMRAVFYPVLALACLVSIAPAYGIGMAAAVMLGVVFAAEGMM